MRALLRSLAGNTFMIFAAAIAPLLALVGGGIDMGRSYLSETRLQQACDSGVLAARKALGSQVVTTGTVPSSVSVIGNRFFNLNFASGAYGSTARRFAMTLGSDYTLSGTASASVPTTIMRVFGQDAIDVKVACAAKLNYSNTDVMMVLDTTGSMAQTNSGDSQSKIAILRQVVKDFYAQLEGSKTPGVRIRFGFVPYSTNVNVGYLLKSEWLVDTGSYEGRVAKDTGKVETVTKYKYTYTTMSGTQSAIAAYFAAACPGSTATWTMIAYGSGNGYEVWDTRVTGTSYSCTNHDGGYTVTGTNYNTYVYRTLKQQDGTETKEVYKWQYKALDVDVSALKGSTGSAAYNGGTVWVRMYGNPSPTPDYMSATFKGCVEERATYTISDYDNVDLTKALDLDIDAVPDPSKPSTQWTPMLHEISFERAWKPTGGAWSKTPVMTTDDYLQASNYGFTTCPAKARKLAEMTASEVAAYVDALSPDGNTYHDVGMIWGGRLLSPTGLFAAENADLGSAATSRHMIFLTDGETAPSEFSYGTYGIEPLSQRRWSSSSPYTLTQTVEKRFTFACNEVKKRNITVWVIGFGTQMTDMLKNCAGNGHWYQADNAVQLNAAFASIAKSMGDIRIVK
ncbi:pilus assembly protein TadG-related protein [Novosphingobium sp. 1949]|uniref:Pilus assembly protein TadG-related protein n=1 Tax=Novosphingobium organovorum TaxID=2930092 RepID=A0ABT0B8M7_9SPHN|nr:Tad domain-containing protein [Novosphingobium organovorum]MCJ2181431.1 pilus assembly protein TadG-related protein [Novosphingobium organovorum]